MSKHYLTNEFENFNIVFGGFIKTVRIKRHLTQEDVARHVGVSQAHINRWEKGVRNIDFNKAVKICTVLRVDIRDFLNDYVYYSMEYAGRIN